MSTLEVCLYGERIGHLQRRGAGAVFEPADEWRWARFQPLLGLSWLQGAGTRSASEGLPVWFEALLPDRSSPLRAELARDKGLNPRDSFALLAAIGTDLPGAVRVCSLAPDDTPTGWPERSAPVGSLHFSLAGAQLKFSLVAGEDHKLVLPVHGAEGQYIAKIAHRDFPTTPRIELVTMRWAALCGHDTAACTLREIRSIGELAHLEQEPGEECLVVQRFDRSPDGPIHQEDLCQVFSLPPAERYSDADPSRVLSYGRLVRFLADACGEGDAREFVRRVAFVLASGNRDAHLQNWSVQLPRDAQPRLTPMYDQLSIIAFPRFGWDIDDGPQLALPFGGERRLAHITERNVRVFAKEAEVGGVFETFIEALRNARRCWPELEAQALLPQRAAIATHWARVPLLASLA